MRRTALTLTLAALTSCADAEPVEPVDVEYGAACPGSDCAPEIPMTGRVSSAFVELDVAMRQFMKFRCVGAGVLAVSLRGRRVYKRGFGRMVGPAAPGLPGCSDGGLADADPHRPDAAFVAPDVPVPVGSVSKIVVAAMVRELIWDRVVERGLADEIGDVERVRLVDPRLELLPTAMRELLGGSACAPVVVRDNDGPECERACDGDGADLRWQLMTIGDLLAHTSGLPPVAADWELSVIDHLALLRGHEARADWDAEDAALQRIYPEFAAAQAGARGWLEAQLGAPVRFVQQSDPADPDPTDEWMRVFLTRCLDRAPYGGPPSAVYGGSYSNTNYSILDRVVSHLSPTGRIGAATGHPEQAADSHLHLFLAQLGVDGGVVGAEAIEHHHRAVGIPGHHDPGPVPRAWSRRAHSYTWTEHDAKRPFCVVAGDGCDFEPWRTTPGLRFPWDFQGAGDGPAEVPFWASGPSLTVGTGALAVEAPALLRVINRHAVGNDDNLQGRRRDTCGDDCDHKMIKSGGMGGALAYAISVADERRTIGLPQPDVHGHLTDDGPIVSVEIQEYPGVDAVAVVAQSEDARDGGTMGYGNLDETVRWGLSRVDWAQVERELAAEDTRVVGMAVAGDRTTLWYASDVVRSFAGPPDAPPTAPLREAPYRLPATRTGADILALAAAPDGRVHAWYDDGRHGVGDAEDLRGAVAPFRPASGRTPHQLVAVALTSGGAAIAWYSDQTLSRGAPDDLGADGDAPFTLPGGQVAGDIVGVALAGERVWVRYRDGSVSVGEPEALASFAYTPAD